MSAEELTLQEFDQSFRSTHSLIVGVDEAGRGPLAGPVTAGAVIFDKDLDFHLIRDSKKLSEKQREEAYEWIVAHAKAWSVHCLGVQAINKTNILQAAMDAMVKAVEKLNLPQAYILIDGNRVPEELKAKGEAIVSGDSHSFSIAAASILAKVTRDRIMRRWAEIYPEYKFEKHKGYGTGDHIRAIYKHLPTPIHRRYFAPVKSFQFPYPLSTQALGKWGENWAIYYLILKGYHFIERNYHGGNKGEIDVVMKKGELFVMVEVKTSITEDEFQAAERVTNEKIEKMTEATDHYFYKLNMDEYDVRFDAVTVTGTDWHTPHIEHYEDIIF
ncbi:MAG: ribonuclease HII [Candidatus Neomarinimicrobiota bacterium]